MLTARAQRLPALCATRNAGAGFCLDYLHTLLCLLAPLTLAWREIPRVAVSEVLERAPPPLGLDPALRTLLFKDPAAFVDRCFRGRVECHAADSPKQWCAPLVGVACTGRTWRAARQRQVAPGSG